MARRSSIPDFGIEYPEYEYREWPKQVGLDANGDQITAKDQVEYDALKDDVVFPQVMGKDKHGKDVVAYLPRDLDWKKDQVVKTSVPSTEDDNALQTKRGPGRPRADQAA